MVTGPGRPWIPRLIEHVIEHYSLKWPVFFLVELKLALAARRPASEEKER